MKNGFLEIQFVIFRRNVLFLFGFLMMASSGFSQEKGKPDPEEKEAQNRLRHAQKSMQRDKFSEAEADYRKAISLDNKNTTAKYNLGTAYYDRNKNDEAMFRFKQAVKSAKTKEERHRALHNLGNTFMNAKKYQEAVETYKEALRNNPSDDETRYNLALAKELLEKNPPPPDDQNDDDQDNQDQQDQQDQQDRQDEQDQENESDSDKGEKDDNENDENDDEGDRDDEDEGNPDQPEDTDSESPQDSSGQLSPEQIESLLEAMENEERKVQEKMNAEKQKGIKVESDKYW